MSMVDTMTARFGSAHLKGPANRREMYGMADVMVDALNNHRDALAALEVRLAAVEGKQAKARVRVPAIRGETR